MFIRGEIWEVIRICGSDKEIEVDPEKVKAEIEKQWNAGFLEVVKYPQWVSNIVVVPKKEGKIRVCVDLGT